MLQWTENYALRLYWMHVYTYEEFKTWGAENMVASGHSLRAGLSRYAPPSAQVSPSVPVPPCLRAAPYLRAGFSRYAPPSAPVSPSVPVSPRTHRFRLDPNLLVSVSNIFLVTVCVVYPAIGFQSTSLPAAIGSQSSRNR